jgi:probable rRNA maturation factor
MVQVHFKNVKVRPGLRRLLHLAAQKTLDHQSITFQDQLSILLTNDNALQALNRQHLDKDYPTDVLAFPAAETDPENGAAYLGDVIISIEQAEVQAGRAGHTLEAELQLLVVHGVLHLLGYDHAGHAEQIVMWQAQSEILNVLNVEIDLKNLDPSEYYK